MPGGAWEIFQDQQLTSSEARPSACIQRLPWPTRGHQPGPPARPGPQALKGPSWALASGFGHSSGGVVSETHQLRSYVVRLNRTGRL